MEKLNVTIFLLKLNNALQLILVAGNRAVKTTRLGGILSKSILVPFCFSQFLGLVILLLLEFATAHPF